MSSIIPTTSQPSSTISVSPTLFPEQKREDDEDEEDWERDEEVQTDGGTVVGFFDLSHPQPWDNSQRMYTVDDPHINPIESIWKSLKWESSPLIVEDEDEYRALLDDPFEQLTEKSSFATS